MEILGMEETATILKERGILEELADVSMDGTMRLNYLASIFHY